LAGVADVVREHTGGPHVGEHVLALGRGDHDIVELRDPEGK
jgi:hypothetical protein